MHNMAPPEPPLSGRVHADSSFPAYVPGETQRADANVSGRRNPRKYGQVLRSAAVVGLCTTARTTSAFSTGLLSRGSSPGVVRRSSATLLGSSSVSSLATARLSPSLYSSFAGLRMPECGVAGGLEHDGRRRGMRRLADGAGALRMGIPKLFRWLTDQYPVISQRLDQGLNDVSCAN